MDPDLGGPKTYGSYGSRFGSAKLLVSCAIVFTLEVRAGHSRILRILLPVLVLVQLPLIFLTSVWHRDSLKEDDYSSHRLAQERGL
jgi:hypothetical protein